MDEAISRLETAFQNDKAMKASVSGSQQRHIVVLVYPDVMAMDVCGPMEAFAMANLLANQSLY